jgi:predicted Fe-Mo cluster-binding NifX family protein
MKVAITAEGPSLDALVDPRFGRCTCFLVVETEDLSFKVLENPNAAMAGGAGIQAAEYMADEGVEYILTGHCGPNAYKALSAAGIGVITECSGVVRKIVEQFKAGKLAPAGRPNVAGHFGTSSAPTAPGIGMPGAGMGRGQAGGRGTGQGRGRGMGAGGGRGMGRRRGSR